MADKSGDITEIRNRFIEQMGMIAQSDGLPRIAGRLMGLMVFDGGLHSFGSLAEQLQVSRGSVSSNTRLLEDQGIIERTTVPGERQDYFQLGEDPYGRLLGSVARRNENARDAVSKTLGRLPRGNDERKSRLTHLESLYRDVGAVIEAVVQKRKI